MSDPMLPRISLHDLSVAYYARVLKCRDSPESQGLICASIYIVLLILFIPYAFSESINNNHDSPRTAREGLVVDEFPHHQVSTHSLVSGRIYPMYVIAS